MEQLLNRSSGISDLSFLRILQLVHVQTTILVDDLKAYEVPSIVTRSPLDTSRQRGGNSGATPTTTAIGTMLETAIEELFVPYTEGQRYLERESKCLGGLYSCHLLPFTRYHVNLQAPSTVTQYV